MVRLLVSRNACGWHWSQDFVSSSVANPERQPLQYPPRKPLWTLSRIQSEIPSKTLTSSGCLRPCGGRIMPYVSKRFHIDVWDAMTGFHWHPWVSHVQLIGKPGLQAGHETSRAVLGLTNHPLPVWHLTWKLGNHYHVMAKSHAPLCM